MNKTLVAFTLILATAFAAFSDITITATYSMASSTGNIINGGVASAGFGTKVANAGKFTQATYDDFIVGGTKGKAYVIKGLSSARTAAMDLYSASATNFITLSLPTGEATSETTVFVAPAGKFTSTTRDSVIVSMPGYDATSTNVRSGRAFVIYPRDSDLDFSAASSGANFWANSASTGIEIVPIAVAANNILGTGISGVGDVTGDTFDDVAVSLKNVVYVVPGVGATAPTSNIAAAGTIVLSGLTAETDFGAYIAGDFDFNGDTKDDLVVGAPGADKAYVYYGQTAKTNFIAVDLNSSPDTARYTVISHTAGIKFGFNVANAGDVNNDGADDLIVGAPQYSTTGTNYEGRAFVIFGEVKASGVSVGTTIAAQSVTPSAAPKGYHITGVTTNLQLGYENDGVGDINADGFDDIIVSAPGAPASRSTLTGKVLVIYGKANANTYNIDLSAATGNTAFSSTVGFTITGEANTGFGASVSYAGDVTGDGAPDFIVGAPLSASRSLDASATARATPGVVYQFNGQVKASTGSGFRLEASLLVIVSFFAALMF